jgi:hypothetical protein
MCRTCSSFSVCVAVTAPPLGRPLANGGRRGTSSVGKRVGQGTGVVRTGLLIVTPRSRATHRPRVARAPSRRGPPDDRCIGAGTRKVHHRSNTPHGCTRPGRGAQHIPAPLPGGRLNSSVDQTDLSGTATGPGRLVRP